MPISKDYYITTGKHGILDTTTPADIDQMFLNLKSQSKIALYFHGGLVPQAAGIGVAEKLFHIFDDDKVCPVFFVYESGFLEIVTRNLPEIVGEEVFKSLLQHLLGKVVGTIRGSANGRGFGDERPTDIEIHQELIKRVAEQEPFADEPVDRDSLDVSAADQGAFQRELAADQNLVTTLQAIADSAQPETVVANNSRGIMVRAVKSPNTLLSPDVVQELVTEQSAQGRGLFTGIGFLIRAAKVLVRIIERFKRHRDHGVYPTIVEELLREFYVANIGLAVWGAIKEETSDTFKDVAGENRGGDIFLNKLAAQLDAVPDHANWPEISLVGHSTGAVFINNLLTAVKARQNAGTFPPGFKFKHVVFLAPASTFWGFNAMLNSSRELFESLRLFGMQDGRECDDKIVPYVYTRSLLYFVSGVVETDAQGNSMADIPILGMQRFHTTPDVYNDADDVAVRAYVEAVADQAIWSPANGGPGLNTDSSHHGDFDDDVETLQSVSDILK